MMIRVGNDQICMIITVKVTVWAMKMDLCDHHRSQGDDGGDWFVDERSVIITAMMAWMYTVRRLKEVFEVVSDIVFAEHRCRYFGAEIIRIQLGIQR